MQVLRLRCASFRVTDTEVTMVRIGTAGWGIPRALAQEFPGEGSHLERYARRLSCAEINSSFYKLPRAGTWDRWAASVPEGFRFAVKAPRAITHEGRLRDAGAVLEEFLAAARRLGGRLGPLLFQLPPKLEFEANVAAEFFRLLRQMHAGTVVLEPRHASWFSERVSEMLAGFEVARVAADPARVPEAAAPGGWAGMRYWRLHGSPRMYYSSYERVRLEELAAQVRDEDWVVFDNTASGAGAGNAVELDGLVQGSRGQVPDPTIPAPSRGDHGAPGFGGRLGSDE